MAIVRKSNYYALRSGDVIRIKKSVNPLKRITEKLVIPKLKNSPTYTPDGGLNRGIIINRISYTGGLDVGSMSYRTFHRLTNMIVPEDDCKLIPRNIKSDIANFLDRSKGDN